MSALKLFPKRIPEPKELNDLEMGVFERLGQANYKRWILPLVDNFIKQTRLKKGFVVDVACGPGLLSKEIASRNQQISVVGIDTSKIALKLARKNTYELKNVTFKEASVYQLPFDNNFVDAVICKDSLHHFDNLKKALTEMLRIIKPGGYLYIQDMRRDLPLYLIKRSAGLNSPIEQLQYYSTRAAYTKQEVRKILSEIKVKPLLLRTQNLTHRVKNRYSRLGINTTQLREGFQARYNLVVRK